MKMKLSNPKRTYEKDYYILFLRLCNKYIFFRLL